jgi:DNA-binding beta-propeller fold protein YncE
MPSPTQTQLKSGLGGTIGCDFRAAQNELIFVEYDGKLSALTVAPAVPAYTVLGTGYNQPEDVKLSVDGVHAYITERTGDLVRVALSNADRSFATVVASGMTAPQQLFLDEAHDSAYVVEYAAAGKLLKVNLTSGATTVVASGLDNPVGVVLSADLQYAYVSEQTTGPERGRISKIQISTAGRTTLASGLVNPFFLTWADAAQDSLFVPQRDPANSILAPFQRRIALRGSSVDLLRFRDR